MIREMILPQLGMGMSEGKLLRWLVREGARIEQEETVLEIETEKVATELPAPYSGFIHILVAADSVVHIETPVAQIAESEEEYWGLLATGDPGARSADAPKAEAASRESSAAVVGALKSGHRVSGAAKRLAEEHSIRIDSIQGSGPDGRIVREDVVAAIARKSSTLPDGPALSRDSELIRIPVTGARKVIADRTAAAKSTAAHTYGYFEIDVTDLMAARRTAEAGSLGGRISVIAYLARALALACKEVPICNSTLIEGEIIVWKGVNIGVVVSLPGESEYESSLVTPVVHNAQNKNVGALDAEIKELVAKARQRRLSLEEVSSGTITLSSNAGFFPGLWALGTPFISLPQVFAFQPGSAIEKPVVVNGNVVVRTMLPCGISFDHRALDGAPAGRFVTALAGFLSNPKLLT